MIVALALLAVVAIALLQVVVGNLRATEDARDRTEAVALAQAQLVELERLPDLEEGAYVGQFGEAHPGFSWSGSIRATPWPELKQVTVKVQWRRGRRDKELVLETLARRHPGEEKEPGTLPAEEKGLP